MVLNISSDIMIILIPMPVFLQSKIAPKKKLILCGVFAVGCFTVSRPFSRAPLSPKPDQGSVTAGPRNPADM